MNAAIFWRIFWKEWRAQRAFWIAIAVLTLVMELLFLTVPRSRDPAEQPDTDTGDV